MGLVTYKCLQGANTCLMKNDPKLTTQMLQHRKISNARMIFEICFDWLQILILLILYMWHPTWLVLLFVFIVIGSRQYSLLILLHDAQHRLLNSNRKINDRVATWLLAAPAGVIFTKSRLNHMQHHQNLGIADGDPDFPLYCIKEPEPKDTSLKLVLHFLHQIFLGKFQRVFFTNNKNNKQITNNVRTSTMPHATELIAILVCQSIIFSCFTIAGYWYAYFCLWILPLIIVASFLNDVRIFCEHSNPQDELDKDKGLLISYLSTPIERFFFSPHHMNYHAEHHFFPFIPHYHLPKVRRALNIIPEYQNQIQWRRGYCAHMKNFIKNINIFSVEKSPDKPSSETI